MKDRRLTRLSTAELLDIRDYINSLLKERYATERRKIEEVIARIESAGGSRSGRDSVMQSDRRSGARRGRQSRSLSRATKRKQKSKHSGRKKRAAR
jgi:hypothetical protein